jgi:hypothetical protein
MRAGFQAHGRGLHINFQVCNPPRHVGIMVLRQSEVPVVESPGVRTKEGVKLVHRFQMLEHARSVSRMAL